jgi:hypothetical protein
MGLFDKVRDVADKLGGSDDEGPAKGSPAAASGGAAVPQGDPGEETSAGSSRENPQAAYGGADAVPATPDATPSTRLDEGGEDKPKHEDQRAEDIVGVSPSENVPNSERDDV